MLQLIGLFIFISLFIFIYAFASYIVRRRNSIYRLNKYINIEELREQKARNHHKEYRIGFDFVARAIGSVKILDGYKNRIQKQLIRAHILLKAEEFITICLMLAMAAGVIFFMVTRSSLYLLLGISCGWMIPPIFVRSRIKKRLKLLNEQLGDALSLISNSLKAGYSFLQAIDTVAREMKGPIAEEFSATQKEISLGLNTEDALQNLSDRVNSDDLELVVTAVLIQKQVGGNLAEVLDNISTTIRERVKIKGEVKTVTAQGRISGFIISLLPVVLGLILFTINPEHIMVLFTDPAGIAILIFSMIMQLTGIFAISRIVKIEV